MILRKPYAFLIKHFKKIHVILTLLMIYIIYRSNSLLSFFNEYITKRSFDYTGNLAATYINVYLYLIIFLVIIVTSIIYVLMHQKKKPIFLYLSIIIFYLVSLIVFFQIYNILETLEITAINPQLVRIVRDIILIVTAIQTILTILIGVRAVGFDIKKFNFGEDLQQLEIDVSDDEEFELTVGIDSRTISRRARRQRRELKYFVIENRFVISLIGGILVVIGSVSLILNYQVYNKVYNEGQSFKVNDFVVNVESSYATRYNYRGELIAPKDKIYIAVSSDVLNKANTERFIRLEDVRLFTNRNNYEPLTVRYRSLFDLGEGYSKQPIKSEQQKKFLFVFEINEEEINDNLIFRYTESIYFTVDSLHARYRKVRLSVEPLDDFQTVGTYKIGEEVSFNQSVLEGTRFSIENIEINDKFYYEATDCIQGECDVSVRIILTDYFSNNLRTLLKVSPVFQVSEEAKGIGIDSAGKLIATFGKLRYRIGDNSYESEIANKTPSNRIGEDVFLEVAERIKRADQIELILNVRNREYIYVLK